MVSVGLFEIRIWGQVSWAVFRVSPEVSSGCWLGPWSSVRSNGAGGPTWAPLTHEPGKMLLLAVAPVSLSGTTWVTSWHGGRFSLEWMDREAKVKAAKPFRISRRSHRVFLCHFLLVTEGLTQCVVYVGWTSSGCERWGFGSLGGIGRLVRKEDQ